MGRARRSRWRPSGPSSSEARFLSFLSMRLKLLH
jgi:hypothetical protein